MMMAMCLGSLLGSIDSFKLILGCAINAFRAKYFLFRPLNF
jgi:hypothetical protein